MTASLFSIETGSGEVDTPLKIWGDLNVRCPEILVWALHHIKPHQIEWKDLKNYPYLKNDGFFSN